MSHQVQTVKALRYLQGDDLYVWFVSRRPDACTGQMKTVQFLHIVEAAGRHFLPVQENMSFGIGVYNAGKNTQALPAYLLGVNTWLSGHQNPSKCSPEHMWLIEPGQSIMIDRWMQPDGSGESFVTPVDCGYQQASLVSKAEIAQLLPVSLGEMAIYARGEELVVKHAQAQQNAAGGLYYESARLPVPPLHLIHRVALQKLLEQAYMVRVDWSFDRVRSEQNWFVHTPQEFVAAKPQPKVVLFGNSPTWRRSGLDMSK